MLDAIDNTKHTERLDRARAISDCLGFPCETADQARWWRERLTYVQALLAEHEEDRQLLVRPILDDKKRIDDIFKKAASEADYVKAVIKKKLGAYEELQLQARNASIAEAVKASKEGDYEVAQLALESLPAAESNGTRWVWEVSDIDPTLLPDEYWCIDHKKIHALTAKSETQPIIPGLTFRRLVVISARKGGNSG